MTDQYDPLDRLGRGDDSALVADPGFADRLEATLRAAHGDQRRASTPLWRRLVVVAPAMLVLLVVASVVIVARAESPSAALVLTDASNVTVHLPDGTSVVDPADGLVLVEGSVIEIGDGGTATIDEVTVDTTAVLTVRDGLLVSDVAGTTTTDRAIDPTTSAPVSDRGTTSAPDTGRTTTTTTATTTSRVVDSVTTVPTSSASDAAPADDSRDRPPADDPAAHHVALEISLRVRVSEEGVRVAWNVVGAEEGWTTMVIRRTRDVSRDAEPGSGVDALLTDPGLVVVAETAGSGPGELLDDPDLGDGRVGYRVLVLDSARGIVGSSPAQAVGR